MRDIAVASPMEGFEGPDGETFRRVWNRVMPDQSLSPVALREEPPAIQTSQDHYIGGLEAMLDGTRQWQGRWEQLATRQPAGGKTAVALRGLAGGESRQLQRLATLYFLLTGGHYLPRAHQEGWNQPLRDSLRQAFLQQNSWEGRYLHMEQQLDGGGMADLIQELHQGSLDQSRQLRRLLEGNLPQRRATRM